MEKDFKFINQKDIYQYKFYMIPKELFVNERYISLSPAAILLYGILLDRLTLSIKNNWVDKNGNIYLIFTRKEIESILHISDKTCTKTFKELVDAKLLLEKSQGKAKPKLLYPAQMVHDEKFDYLTRKNSDSRQKNLRLMNRKIYDLTILIIKILIKLIRIIAIMNKDNIQKNFLIAYMPIWLIKEDLKNG